MIAVLFDLIGTFQLQTVQRVLLLKTEMHVRTEMYNKICQLYYRLVQLYLAAFLTATTDNTQHNIKLKDPHASTTNCAPGEWARRQHMGVGYSNMSQHCSHSEPHAQAYWRHAAKRSSLLG